MIKLAVLTLLYLLIPDPAEAGPVVAAIGAMWTAVGTWAATTVMGAAVLQTAIGVGLTALSRVIWQPEEPKQAGITTQSTTKGEKVPQSIIVGRYATEGHLNCPPMAYETDDDPNEWLVYVMELSDRPITGYGRIWIEGEEATFESAPNDPATVINTANMGATVTGKFNNKVFVRLHMGNQTTADRYLVDAMGSYPNRPWSADMVLRGVSYMVITFKGRPKDEVFTGGFPAVRIEVDGMPLYDPRTGTSAFSDNPMTMAYNVVRGITMANGDKWGYNIPDADIIQSRAIASINACDQLVDKPGGGTEKRYRAGFEFRVSDQPADVLQKFLDACHGQFSDMGGEIILSAGPPGPAVFSFTDNDLIITSPEDFEPFSGQDKIFNSASANYPDPKSWETRESHSYENAGWIAEDGQKLVAKLALPAVPFPTQVRRLIRELVADNRRFRNHMITLPPDAGGIMVLDTVSWNSPYNGYTTKLFEVVQKYIDPYTDCVTLQIRERDPSDYNPNVFLDDLLPIVVDPLPVYRPPVGVLGFDAQPVLIEGANGQIRPGFRMTWNNAIAADSIAWEVALMADRTKVVNQNSTTNVDRGFQVIQAGILSATWYSFRAKRVFKNRSTSWGPWIDRQSLVALIGSPDLDMEVIQNEIRLQIGEVDAWFGEQGADIRQILDEIYDIKDRIVETDFGSYTQREEIRQSLQLQLADAEARFEERITVAVGDVSGSISQHLTQLQADVGTNSSRITAEATARADADSAMTLRINTAESVLGRGENVIADQYLKTVVAPGWNRWSTGGTLSRAPSPMYALGTAWTFNVTDAAQQAGLQINSQNDDTWPGAVDADGYVVEIEYSLLSGTLAGAGVQVAWFNAANVAFVTNIRLDKMVAGSTMFGRASTARAVFKRPANAVADATTWNRVIVFANYTGGTIGPGGVKNIRFDRVRVRTATAEELGKGAVLDEITARIGDLDFTDVDKDGAYALRMELLESNWEDASGTLSAHATAIDNRYTKTETNQAISGRIQSWAANFTDGSNVGLSNVINAIRTRVGKTETGIESHTTQLIDVRARTNRGTATGRLRVTAESTPAGALSRIGLRAEASSDTETQSAALFLEAKTGGLSTVGVMADRFFIADASGPAANRVVPFFTQNGIVYINKARIRSGDIDTLKLADGAATMMWSVDAWNVRLNLTYPANVLVLTNCRIMGVSNVYTFSYVLRRNGNIVQNLAYSLSQYTYPYTNTIGLRLAAGTHEFRFTMERNGAAITDANTPNITVFAGYK